MDWLIDETGPLDDGVLAEEAADIAVAVRGRRSPLAIRVSDVVIHDARKWFGGADIRLDAVVVHAAGDPSASVVDQYQPGTFRFPGVRSGDRLPIEAPGLLLYYGRPKHFLDVSILASRDRGDSEDLGQLLSEGLNSAEGQAASTTLLSLVAAPQAAAVAAALGAAAIISQMAAKALAAVTGDTIGLYRASWLRSRDGFGIGRHPESGSYRKQEMSFWYEILLDEAPAETTR